MTRTFKKAGFKQGIYAISSTKKERLGTLRITQDGRKFRYAKAGASALSPGKLTGAAAVAADVMNEACASAHAIGDVVISETITSATYAADYFQDGFLQINDGTGEGHQYQIESSSQVAAGTSIVITLVDPIKVALVATTTQFSLLQNPWMATIITATPEITVVGIPPVDVTAAYYYWSQTGGPALCLSGDTAAVGTMMVPGATDGSMVAITAATVDIDLPYFGIAMGTAGVTAEYKPIMLIID